jgi:hypothetical protein
MKSQLVWTVLLIVGLFCSVSARAYDCGMSLGDRIELTVDHPSGSPTLWTGMRGTVICLDYSDGYMPVLASWDGWIGGHESTSFCETAVLPHLSHSCWWMTCSAIKLVQPGVPDILDGGEQDRSCRPQTFVAGQANQPIEVSFNVFNGGTGNPPEPIYVRVYLSEDTWITPSDYYLGETNCYISAGGSLQKTLKTTLPTHVPAGFYYVGWIMDPDNLIPDELDEANNRAYLTSYRIVVTGSSTSRCLELSAARGGRITAPEEGVFVYPSARQVSVAASPDPGCSFAGWVGTAVEAGKVTDPDSASTQVFVDARYSLTAVFGGPHMVLEDFEDYNSVDPVNAVWVDGLGWNVGDPQGHPGNDTGAIIGNAGWPTPGNPTIHGGIQAMAFDYDNGRSPYYSEAFRQWGTLQNWAATGADTLGIWYRGAPGNSVQPLYAVIGDFYRTEAVMMHPENLAVRDGEWSQWTIPLEDIQEAGVMLSRVVTLYLGAGDRISPFAAGAGTLYFDDIALMHSGSGVTPPGGEPPVVSVDPGTAGLIAYYAFENNVNDLSGNGLNGTIHGAPSYVAGLVKYGKAMSFRATNAGAAGDYVDCGANWRFNLTDAMTVGAWVNIRSIPDQYRGIVTKGDSAWRLATKEATRGFEFAFTGAGRSWQAAYSATQVGLNEWHYVCGTYSKMVGACIYIDGQLDGTNSDKDGIDVDWFSVWIGANSENTGSWPGRYFDGMIDEVRIYDRALSPKEVVFLATR